MSEGFTLIEILIVIAIIGILAAALVFNSEAALRQGRVTAAKNQGSIVNMAITQWLTQDPLRTADALNNTDCTQPATLTGTGLSSGYQSDSVGWNKPKATITCRIQASGRNVNVITGTDGHSFTNGD